jgi:hypothetical protein
MHKLIIRIIENKKRICKREINCVISFYLENNILTIRELSNKVPLKILIKDNQILKVRIK